MTLTKCEACGKKISEQARSCPSCGHNTAKKSKTVAVLLALLLGGIGAHKFYLGKTGMGILYLLFVWTWIPAIIALIEGIRYALMSEDEFQKAYAPH